MAFWLCRERRGQECTRIQRFDPRFWTVDFPRPAMASVVTTGPDSLRIDCAFQREGDLVGLIWDSEDRLDHPLLAYETSRDYSRTTLSFRWQSTGLIPLDQANGPTLTIEGRDEAGIERTWYVRLWNYADGAPDDATVEISFSDLQAGWALPGDKVVPTDIDRLFISLVAPDFVAGSEALLPDAAQGHVLISEIRCEGQHATLETGDVLLPPHGEHIATAYDDAYNQTPARLIRSALGLGYRGQILHYVGMSHFMALEREDGSLRASSTQALCEPARRWHESYFAISNAYDFEPIVSLSYELFDEYCPESWKQRTHDGKAARTGWEPPSTLLSPCHPQAMQWLRNAALAFVDLLEESGAPVRFQIGEPWWWVTSSGAPCLYDDASVAAHGSDTVVITDMRSPLDTGQLGWLDRAGELLAGSTLELAEAVRNATAGAAEILLLVFTPTILDPSMPELRRANLPQGWAFPAFDRLQVEDYDWLTSGATALRRAGYQLIDQRLGYPSTLQDYVSGFVLSGDDSDAMWPLIDAGLNQARLRGIEKRFVWALPQVARDGFVRLPRSEEPDMQAFDDVLYPFPLGKSASASPEFSTNVITLASGHERRNSLWSDARVHFDVGPGIRSEEELSKLVAFFRARRGAARGFRFTDPFDFSSHAMTLEPTPFDQLIGIGDGVRSDFQLVKSYGDGPEPQIREITRPRPDSVTVSIDGVVSSDWSIDGKGRINLAVAPQQGQEIRAGFLFDVPVRFAEDRIDVSAVNFSAGEAPSIPLVEIRESVG